MRALFFEKKSLGKKFECFHVSVGAPSQQVSETRNCRSSVDFQDGNGWPGFRTTTGGKDVVARPWWSPRELHCHISKWAKVGETSSVDVNSSSA
jgi:SH3-like domain-containing protein